MAFVTNIEEVNKPDGRGSCKAVFFKGCPLNCKWCPYPEMQDDRREILFYKGRCTACRRCIQACQRHVVSLTSEGIDFDWSRCVRCGRCVLVCQSNALETVGVMYEVDALIKKITQGRRISEEVMLTGGEVMSLPEQYLLKLVKGLETEGLAVHVETCGICSRDLLEAVFPHVDTFFYRSCALSEDRRAEENLRYLQEAGANVYMI